jgi:hypothetical protein
MLNGSLAKRVGAALRADNGELSQYDVNVFTLVHIPQLGQCGGGTGFAVDSTAQLDELAFDVRVGHRVARMPFGESDFFGDILSAPRTHDDPRGRSVRIHPCKLRRRFDARLLHQPDEGWIVEHRIVK